MNIDLNDSYVYRHIRIDSGMPFYIGIGRTKYRAYSKQCRNILWKRIVAKTDFIVEYLFENVSWDFAAKKEIEFISLYGRVDNFTGILANMTNGGDGNLGLIHTEDGLRRISLSSKNRIGHWKGKKMSQEMRQKLSKSKTGKPHKGTPASQKVKDAVSRHAKGNKYCLGRVISSESRRKISEANLGKKAYNKGLPGLKGELNGMFGKKHTVESRKKNSDSQIKKPVIKLSMSGYLIQEYPSLVQAAKENGIFASGIQATCKGRFNSYKGYKWHYKY